MTHIFDSYFKMNLGRILKYLFIFELIMFGSIIYLCNSLDLYEKVDLGLKSKYINTLCSYSVSITDSICRLSNETRKYTGNNDSLSQQDLKLIETCRRSRELEIKTCEDLDRLVNNFFGNHEIDTSLELNTNEDDEYDDYHHHENYTDYL